MEKIKSLIEISRKYGIDKRFVIAGGGNTSYKNDDEIWVKASGHALATITEDGFAVLDRRKLNLISEKQYSADPALREAQVKDDLNDACLTVGRRPSVETSMHNAIDYAFVVHLHPTIVNGLMCSQEAESQTNALFGDSAVYVPYTDPGYVLFKEVETRINDYKKRHGYHPQIIMLQNHGIFVAADTTYKIDAIYAHVISKIEDKITVVENDETYNVDLSTPTIVPSLRMTLSHYGGLKTLKIRNGSRIKRFLASGKIFQETIATPFTPDAIVYCKSRYPYFAVTPLNTDKLHVHIKREIDQFVEEYGYTPKIVAIKRIGIIAVGDNAAECDTILDVFEDMICVAEIAESFGGAHPMTIEQIAFIDNWEVENYRRKVSVGNSRRSGRLENRTVIITGAAQGFGAGIAECLVKEGANIVVADMNKKAGQATAQQLLDLCSTNRALFIETNVADEQSISQLVYETVRNFGGVDVFISNAGVLRAGGLDDMTAEDFEFVTRINYNAFFYCTKEVSRVMKIQTQYAPYDYYCDVIQINSKSGLRGSKANFAYAGSKFGGIGLAQSFALELAPFRIKVNAICPGNFYDGPLWSNPKNGLFKQYLQAGKVPGAKTINDVRSFYMDQAPMRKGTNPEDVAKAVFYLVEQTCETGQALPVTGGQVMLG